MKLKKAEIAILVGIAVFIAWGVYMANREETEIM